MAYVPRSRNDKYILLERFATQRVKKPQGVQTENIPDVRSGFKVYALELNQLVLEFRVCHLTSWFKGQWHTLHLLGP